MTADGDDGPVSFLERSLLRSLRRTTVMIAPGESWRCDAAVWEDAIVVVEAGTIAVECHGGTTREFETGAVLFLAGLPLRALRNFGAETAVLVSVARISAAATEDGG